MNGQTDDHGQIAVGMAASIATKIAEVMPAIEKHLREGVDRHGLVANIMFRLGQPGRGEAQVVAELEFSMTTGEFQQFMLAPSPVTGMLSIISPLPQQPAPPQGMNGGSHPEMPTMNEYPGQQAVLDQRPPPLVPQVIQQQRAHMAPPNPGQQLTAPPVSELTAPLPPYLGDPTPYMQPQQQPIPGVPPGTSVVPVPGPPVQPPPPQMTQDQYAQWHLQTHGTMPPPPVPVQAQPQRPVRLKRPAMADEGGIR
jgi:hypothetical protein